MNENIGQSEEKQHTVYFNIKRNWTTEQNDNSFYEDKVFFLKDGRIGMECGGLVIVKTIEAWMALSEKEVPPRLTTITIVEKKPHKLLPGEMALYDQDRYPQWWFIGCPHCHTLCGLGVHTVIQDEHGITVSPSIHCSCGAHYLIEQSKIRWC